MEPKKYDVFSKKFLSASDKIDAVRNKECEKMFRDAISADPYAVCTALLAENKLRSEERILSAIKILFELDP